MISEDSVHRLESLTKLISPLLAVLAFGWAIFTYGDTSRRELENRKAETQRTTETRRIEATRPYLERQLTLYTEATRSTATIATSSDPAEVGKATQRFWQLYWGELALVERADVEQAMVAFGQALTANGRQEELRLPALNLAHACRDELAASWGTDAWKR